MRTEADLRAAMQSLEREAPAPAAVLSDLDRPPHRRHTAVLITAAVTATALAAAAIPTYKALTAGGPEPAGPDAAKPSVTSWRYSYTVKPPKGWWQVREGVMAEGQLTTVTSLDDGTCTLFSFERGRLDTRVLTNRQPVTIPGGRKGFVADVATWRPVYESRPVIKSWFVPSGPRPPVRPQPTPRKRVRPVVAFEYATNSWRVVDCAQSDQIEEPAPRRDLAVDRALRVAAGVTDRARVVRSPFSLTYLPSGFADQRVDVLGRPDDYVGQQFQFDVFATGHAPSRLDQSLALPDAAQPEPDPDKPIFRGVTVMVHSGDGPSDVDFKGTRITVSGYPAYVQKDPEPRATDSKGPIYHAQISIDGPSDRFTVKIESMTGEADYTPELLKIAKGMRLPADSGAWPGPVPKQNPRWIDADKAFPRP